MSTQQAPFEVIEEIASSRWDTPRPDDSSPGQVETLEADPSPVAEGADNVETAAPGKPMAGLRICHLGKYYPPAPGGIETHVQTLARAQAALGAQVTVLCVDHTRRTFDRPISTDLAGSVLTVESIGKNDVALSKTTRNHENRNEAEDGHSWSEPDGEVRVVRAIAKRSIHRLELCPGLPALLAELEANGTHLLHLHTPNPTMLLAVARAKPKIPLVITHHSDIVRQRILKWVMRPLERLVYRRAARVQATSLVYRQASSFLHRYDNRTDVLPLGLDLTTFTRPSRAALEHAHSLRRHHGPPLWLSVGRLVYYKGYDVAIKALRHVPGTLMIVGNGPLEADLKELARNEGVFDRIVWRGYLSRDELAGAYLASAALWFPSNARSEAFGLVQVEAMAAGCPVINTHIPGSGVPWVSRHEESGLTVAVNDPTDLAAAAKRLLSEEGLRQRLSLGAKMRAITEFDHLTMARRSLRIYRTAMGQPEKEIAEESPSHAASHRPTPVTQSASPLLKSDHNVSHPAHNATHPSSAPIKKKGSAHSVRAVPASSGGR